MISGIQLSDAIISGANNITNHKQQVDELNVFPVPDGDTGTNMSMTINAAARELAKLSVPTATKVADVTASSLLRGARGNSGVILSLLFRGFAVGMKGKEEVGGADIAAALDAGVKAAYKAVMKPTEGTILTVARLAAEHALKQQTNDPAEMLEAVLGEAKKALQQTPELLPVLKKAGVVDAGGQGFVFILEGMLSVIRDGKKIEADVVQPLPKAPAVSSGSAYDVDFDFTYCTEFIVNKSKDCPDALKLRAYLETIGDCVVVVDDDDIIKVHVHSENPGLALQEGLKFGMLSNMKIENMREQHEKQVHNAEQASKDSAYVPVDPDIEYGFVAVAAGQGLHALFTDLGVNNIVTGGQTMNPSTDDILHAIEATPAKTVFVLPNNKNIIMAAEQVVPLADRKVCVLQTRTIPQGLSAMLAFDPEAGTEENLRAMTKAIDKVSTGQITFAARDSDYDGHSIKAGEILALDNGKLSFTEKDVTKALVKLTRKLVNSSSEFVTVIYGNSVSDFQAEEARQSLEAKLGDHLQVNMVNGGQPVYYYIISVE